MNYPRVFTWTHDDRIHWLVYEDGTVVIEDLASARALRESDSSLEDLENCSTSPFTNMVELEELV